MERLLTGDEVYKISGPKTKLILYPQLKKYASIEQLFGRDEKVIILYITEQERNSTVGHWVLLTKIVRNGKVIVEFNDSYGLLLDDEIDFNSYEKQVQFGQSERLLTRLLYTFSLDPKHEVHYNEKKLQKLKNGVNSCGRWVALRAKYYKIPLEQYQKIWENLQKEGYNLDDFAVALTDNLLNK